MRSLIGTTIAELMHANLLEVFNERDRARRCAAIARIYSDDIRWTDDDGVTTGRAALDAKAVELQAKLGDLQFIAAGPAYQTLGLGYLAFNVVNPAVAPRRARASTSRRARRPHRRALHGAHRPATMKRWGCSRRRRCSMSPAWLTTSNA